MSLENHLLTVDAVIFDLDGTLIDSAPIYYELIDVIFERLGIPPVSKKVLLDAMKDGEFEWELVLPDEMKPRKEEVIKNARTIIDDIAPSMFRKQVKLIPGTAEVLKDIAAAGMKLALATSTLRDYMALKLAPLREVGIETLLEVVITADDVQNKKPHAEPLVKCSRKLGLEPGQCAYVGDTRVDIRAGKAAGMHTVGVLTGFDGYEALKNEKPTVIIDSIADLKSTLAL
ncbi:MAG: HAD family hydrolase [Desulfobacterales bacterium]|nr:MAG: HAD family hydrolase [Desulfobacterales bacterium]